MNPPRTPTPVLIKALEALSRDVQSEDGVANAALFEAAQRMKDLDEALNLCSKQCQDLHHPKAMQHALGAPCPVEAKIRMALGRSD